MTNTYQEKESEPFQGWAIVELMGHVRLAGKLSEQKLAGMSYLKLDIPAKSGTQAAEESEFSATQFINPGSVYRISPVSEEVARAVAHSMAPDPVSVWDIKSLLPAAKPSEPLRDNGRPLVDARPLPEFGYNEQTDNYEEVDEDDIPDDDQDRYGKGF